MPIEVDGAKRGSVPVCLSLASATPPRPPFPGATAAAYAEILNSGLNKPETKLFFLNQSIVKCVFQWKAQNSRKTLTCTKMATTLLKS